MLSTVISVMSYVGGKANSASHILAVLNHPVFNGMHYVEPFVGYAHVLRRVINKRSYTASDANPLLMLLLRAVQRGKSLPIVRDANEYHRLKHQRGTTLARAVAAFTYSFNGKEWGGYTPTYKGCSSTVSRNPPDERRRYYKKLYENDAFRSARLTEASYHELKPKHKLIYCDPPYEDTTGYSSHFDHDHFWDVMRAWSRDNIVFISEYRAPKDFVCVTSLEKNMILPGADYTEKRVECLFTHKSCLPLIAERADYFNIKMGHILKSFK